VHLMVHLFVVVPLLFGSWDSASAGVSPDGHPNDQDEGAIARDDLWHSTGQHSLQGSEQPS